MAKIAHSMIRVLDEAASVAFYKAAFDMEIADRLDFDEFTLIYLTAPEGSFELELTINKAQSEPYELGNGYGHLALVVEDLEHARAKVEAASDVYKRQRVARFFFVADPDGYQIEVIEAGGRFR